MLLSVQWIRIRSILWLCVPAPVNLSHYLLSPPDRIGDGADGRRNPLPAFILGQLPCRKNGCHDSDHALSSFVHDRAPRGEPRAADALNYPRVSTLFVFCSPILYNPEGGVVGRMLSWKPPAAWSQRLHREDRII